MNNPYLGYNPVFEQLAETARNNSNKLQEAAGDIDAKETQEYLSLIIDTLSNNVLKFIGSLPYQDLKTQIYPGALEKYTKLSNNASIRDLFTNLYAIWKDAMEKIKASKYKGSTDFIKIYTDANAGIDKIMQSWAALQTKAGNILQEPALVDFTNSKMQTLVASVQSSLDAAKTTLS
jgi:hypothetical protein